MDRRGKRLQKFEYFQNERRFLNEIEVIFLVKGLSFGEKIKNNGLYKMRQGCKLIKIRSATAIAYIHKMGI